MAINGILADVDFPIWEPIVERGVRAVKDFGGEFVPFHVLGLLSPEVLPGFGVGRSFESNSISIALR